MAICTQCGKEFEARGDWQKVCIDCYKAGASSKPKASASKVTAGSGKSASTTGKKNVSAELFVQAYDELIAAFEGRVDEVKDYLGGWVSTIVINRSK